VQQKVDMGSGVKQDRKSPNTLAYQAGVRGSLQLSGWSPYLAAGAGGMTFLSNSDRIGFRSSTSRRRCSP